MYLQKRSRLIDDRSDLGLPRWMSVGEGRTGSLGLADANYYI